MHILNIFKIVRNEFIKRNSVFIVNYFEGGFWNFRSKLKSEGGGENKKLLYDSYCEHYCSWIGLGATFDGIPILPHGLFGIFISNTARIGKNVVIFHQVTIGSNMTQGSKKHGSPCIDDNVYIGCGSKIIGNIKIGKNARIGANCVVFRDVPANSVTVIRGIESIIKDYELNNEWVKNDFVVKKGSII